MHCPPTHKECLDPIPSSGVLHGRKGETRLRVYPFSRSEAPQWGSSAALIEGAESFGGTAGCVVAADIEVEF